MAYLYNILILICIYSLLSQSLNLSAGYTGLISLVQAGFYGIGAYTSAILANTFDWSFWINIPIAMFICGTVAIILSLIALRTIDDYFIICTLGMQVIIFSIMNNWMEITRGPLGIPGIPPIHLFRISLNNHGSYLALSVTFVLIIWYILRNISHSGFGKTLRAISEDEIYTLSIGKNVHQSKIISFTISAILAAIPGALYAHYISYIDPTSFSINESIFILSIIIIGGLGNFTGSIFASAFLVLLPEGLRFIGLPDNIAANLRQIIYGIILVIIMITGKNGIKESFRSKKHQRIMYS